MSRGGIMRITLFVLLVCLLVACRDHGEIPSSVLLRVNERVTTLDQFQSDFARELAAEGNMSEAQIEELKRSFLAQKIDRELILCEADRTAIAIPREVLEAAVAENLAEYPAGDFERMLKKQGLTRENWRLRMEDNLRIEKVVRSLAYARATVEEKEIAEYFRNHRAEFDRPEQVRARQIAVHSEEEGRRVLGLLRQGRTFAEAAKRFSHSPDSEQGGDLGYFGRGEMPAEFDQVVFSLPVGRISEVVRSEYGYHIFLVEERRAASRLTLPEVHEEIAAQLKEIKEEQAYQEWLQALREKAIIEVDWSLL
jgi:peptidyl-prolyl cis-trans isomerase C